MSDAREAKAQRIAEAAERRRSYLARDETGSPLLALSDCIELADAYLALAPAGGGDGGEAADSDWAESIGFRWSTDGTAMLLSDGGWEVLLSGDVAECEKPRSLTLMGAASHVGGIKVQAARVLEDDPTRGHVRRLLAALGITARPAPEETTDG